MKRRPGFTLIEILIVIAIIGILSTLLLVGISKLKITANRQQTHQLLQTCQSQWQEYQSSQHLHFDQFEIDAPGNMSQDSEAAYEASSGGNLGNRIGLQVGITRALFTQMRSIANIKAGGDKFPANRMLLPVTGNGSYGVFNNSLAPWASGINYLPGIYYVTYAPPNSGYQPVAYLSIKNHWSSSGNFVSPTDPPNSPPQPYNGPPNTACWFSLLGDPNIPVILDAWGNPIIVVLGGVLGDGPVGTFNMQSGSGFITAGGVQHQVINPTGLFFASAGPDQDFTKGDDNMYSIDPW